jgi:hypothetical protein
MDISVLINKFSKCEDFTPFRHWVIDNFFDENLASGLESDFPDFRSDKWFLYDNPLENKKALNDWNLFPELTYSIFNFLYSPVFVNFLSDLTGVRLFPDSGLHGGGWHIHGNGGNLNPHLDYSIHPKIHLQRKFNLIIYLSNNFVDLSTGGQLGFWGHNSILNAPGFLMKEILPLFNRAVLFDTSQNSWHGLSQSIVCPDSVYRKSIAIYYLCEPEADSLKHSRAIYAPRNNQQDDKNILDLISKRSSILTSSDVYVSK